MRYLCSGSLSTFRCAIPSILTIGGYGSPTRVGVSSVFSLFTRKSRRAEKRAGWRPESWGSGPWMRYQLHVVRQCRRGRVKKGKRGRGEVPSNNRSSIVPSRYIHVPIPGFRPPRVSSRVICTYQLCLPATKGPSMTSLSLLRRDPMILTAAF